MTYIEFCQSLVGTDQKTTHGDTVKILKYWVAKTGKDMFWIELGSKKRMDVESEYITDTVKNIRFDSMKLIDVYGIKMNSIEQGAFAKHLSNNSIAMNTKTTDERLSIAINWLNEYLTNANGKKHTVGQRVIAIKDGVTIEGVISKVIPEMQYEIVGYNGSLRSVDHAHIVSSEDGNCRKISGENFPYNEANNTIYFDSSWLVIETDEVGEYVVTIAGNEFYLDLELSENPKYKLVDYADETGNDNGIIDAKFMNAETARQSNISLSESGSNRKWIL